MQETRSNPPKSRLRPSANLTSKKGKHFLVFLPVLIVGISILGAIYYASRYPTTDRNAHSSLDSARLPSSDTLKREQQLPRQNSHSTMTVSAEGHDTAELPPGEREIFFEDITQVFGTIGVATVDADRMAPHLSRLNARGPSGLRAVTSELKEPPKTDTAVRQRIHLIDYLNYRMRWDPEAKVAALQIIREPLPNDTSPRYKAAAIIEKSEIIGGLAAIDWHAAADALRPLENGRLRRIALRSALDSLVDHGHGKEEALAKIRILEPNFIY